MTTRQPVVEATVSVNAGARPWTAVTDGQGRYKVPDLPSGRYSIGVERYGYQNYERQGVLVTLGQTTVVDVELTPK